VCDVGIVDTKPSVQTYNTFSSLHWEEGRGRGGGKVGGRGRKGRGERRSMKRMRRRRRERVRDRACESKLLEAVNRCVPKPKLPDVEKFLSFNSNSFTAKPY
jgi:hypothetical protein